MFLNKKTLTKIWLLTGAYLALASLCFFIALVFALLQIDCPEMIVFGCFCLLAAPLIYKWGRYAEGKGKLIHKGNQLVTQQLRPMEFIRLYEEKYNDAGNVVSSPDFDVLQLLAAAYDALGETDRTMEVIEQMLLIAPDKKQNAAKLWKCALLFSIGRCEEAEVIYRDVVSSPLDMMSKHLCDVVMRSDRALAMGDDTTAEAHFQQVLTGKFPKPTPLSILYSHYRLAQICHRTGRTEEAKRHLNDCIANGGETALQQQAANGDIFL